jgi:hypothetical protein
VRNKKGNITEELQEKGVWNMTRREEHDKKGGT